MKFREFEQLAHEYWGEIPEHFKRGVDGVRVQRQSKAHDELPDVFTMGECVTEAYPSDFGGPDTTRSAVVLYHGSFVALAELGDDFDWEEELWETLTHELQHHLESLAGEDALEDVDYAADENFKRYEGEPFDPFFYRVGEHLADADLPVLTIGAPLELVGGWRVENDWFFELGYDAGSAPIGGSELRWAGARHAFEIPAPGADVLYLVLGPGFEPRAANGRRVDEACVVLVRRASPWRAAFNVLRGRLPSVEEIEVDVRTTSA